MKKLTVLFASALLALVLVAPASAAVVDVWSYSYNAGFTQWTGTAGQLGIYTDNDANLPIPGDSWYDLSWGSLGDPAARSGISIDLINGGTGLVNTNGPAVSVATLTHNNKIISASYPTLVSGTVTSTFSLSPEVPASPDVTALPTVELEFNFFETMNDSAIPQDVFILNNAEFATGDFEYDGETYYYDFTGSFGVIDAAYINALGLTPGTYYGWVTEENQSTPFDSNVVITHVPEPSTFILLGAGLLGLVGIARRRRRS